MKWNRILAICSCMAILAAVPAVAQHDEMDMEAATEAWAKAAAPGEWHAFFAKKAGQWKIETKMWMQPGADPMVSESTGEAKMILGGRYLYEEMEGESMGQAFAGLGITGYDNTTGIITTTWYDNMGTATGVLTGSCEKPGDPMTMSGTTVDPMSKMEMKVRTVTTFKGDDESFFEYYMSMGEMPEMKVMEMKYTRVK